MTGALITIALLVAGMGVTISIMGVRMGGLRSVIAAKSARIKVLEDELREAMASLDRERSKHAQLEANHAADLEQLRSMISKPSDSTEGASRLNAAARWNK